MVEKCAGVYIAVLSCGEKNDSSERGGGMIEMHNIYPWFILGERIASFLETNVEKRVVSRRRS